MVSAEQSEILRSIERNGGNFLERGVEFYPKCVYDAVKMLKEEFGLTIPIYITENGIHGEN